MNSDIKTFRRFVLALISILFFGLAASSLAQGQIKLEKSLYRVELTGTYVHDWRSQSAEFPRSDRGWTVEEGSVSSGFHTKGNGVVYRGSKLTGEVPKGIPTAFQFSPVGWPRAKANNRQKIKIRRNLIPACGGELGECDGTEPKGLKTISKSCGKANAVVPFSLDYDESKTAWMELDFLYHPSNYEFCGRKYPYFASITELKDRWIKGGVDYVERLKKGRKQTWHHSSEIGEVYGPSTGFETKRSRKCPPMKGEGNQRCWTTDLTLEVTRIK
jgi:hypothetical protein